MSNEMAVENTALDLADNGNQFLTFELSNEIYGVNILNVKEIIDYGCITRVPMMTDFIAGVINLRGSVVPVIDLSLRFSKHKSDKTKRSGIVIIEMKVDDQVMVIGITVDIVNEVIFIFPDDIEPSPLFGTKIRTDFIHGMAKVDGEILVVLDIEKILSIEELSAIDTTV